jgi:hypothetical protein
VTGWEMGVSGSAASGGAASAFFEKSHMLRVAARGTCNRGGRGRRLARWGCVQRRSSEGQRANNKLT